MLRIRWENQGEWIHTPSLWESLSLFFDMRKLVIAMSDWDSPNVLGGGLIPVPYPSEAKMASVPTIAQRLDMAVKQAEERLKAAKRAKELFEKNPDLEELLNIMQRGHF